MRKNIIPLVFVSFVFILSCSDIEKVAPNTKSGTKRDNPIIGLGEVNAVISSREIKDFEKDANSNARWVYNKISMTNYLFFLKNSQVWQFRVTSGGVGTINRDVRPDYGGTGSFGNRLSATAGGLWSNSFQDGVKNGIIWRREKIRAAILPYFSYDGASYSYSWPNDFTLNVSEADLTTNLKVNLTDAMTGLGSNVYCINDGTLWRTYLFGGKSLYQARSLCSNYPTGWNGTEAMTSVSLGFPIYTDFLFAIQGGTLWVVNLNNGSVAPFSRYPYGWEGTQTMAVLNGYLFVIQGGEFWRVSISSGDVVSLGGGWSGPTTMTSLGGYIFTVQGGKLWRTETNGNTILFNGNFDWNGVTQLTGGVD